MATQRYNPDKKRTSPSVQTTGLVTNAVLLAYTLQDNSSNFVEIVITGRETTTGGIFVSKKAVAVQKLLSAPILIGAITSLVPDAVSASLIGLSTSLIIAGNDLQVVATTILGVTVDWQVEMTIFTN